MILECPNCDTHYEIPVELPPEGRKVRCASCQHIWQAMPPEEKPEDTANDDLMEGFAAVQDEAADSAAETTAEADTTAEKPDEDIAPNLAALDEFTDDEIVFKADDPEEDTAEPAPEPEQDAGKEEPEVSAEDLLSDDEMREAFSAAVAEAGMAEEPEPEPEPESPPIVIGKARKQRGSLPVNLAAGWAVLAVALAGIVSFSYFQRVKVVQLLPGAASAYEKIGLPVNVRGLAFEDVKYSWETSAGRPVLEVAGEIVNITGKPLRVPTVVFGLRTKEKVEVYQWAADVRSDMLPPGERTAFAAQIPTPPKSIRDVQVRFAKVQ